MTTPTREDSRQRPTGAGMGNLAAGILAPRSLQSLWELVHADGGGQAGVRHLGQAVLRSGLVGRADIQAMLLRQKTAPAGAPHDPLGRMLVKEGLLTDGQLQTIVSNWLGMQVVDPTALPADPMAIALVSRKHAQHEGLLPLMLRDDTLVVLFASQWDKRQMDELRFITQKTILPVLAAPGTLQTAQDKAYTGCADRVTHASAGEKRPPEGAEHRHTALQLVDDLEKAGALADTPQADVVSESDSVMVRLINSIIEEAVATRASDIHIESDEPPRAVTIRLRIDGELRPYLELDSRFRFALVGRLKIMANLDISEHRRPQDGKIDFARFGHVAVELRMVTVPTSQGREDVVLRLLSAGKPLPLDGIGLSPAHLVALRSGVHRPYGLILVCGPTGCGKTTTLHSVLSDINSVGRKIWTAEDPIEITHPGLRQVQVNARIGWTFAAAMRTFLRADPDVIMIGEMRDEETARIAVEASLTGHLVLSTLHTNSAPESITRLLEIGIDPFNFSDSLLAVLAQRLVRRLCTQCREPRAVGADELAHLAALQGGHESAAGVADDELARQVGRWQRAQVDVLGKHPGDDVVLYRAVGCQACNHTGFKGRLGIHELMTVNDAIRGLIRQRAPAGKFRELAVAQGMHTLRQDGLDKAFIGLTDVGEVMAAANS